MDSIPFELHITVTSLSPAGVNDLLAFCAKHEAKPLLIELSQGECIHQPMVSKIVSLSSLEEALDIATELSVELNAQNLKVNRLKIEVPANCSDHWDGVSDRYFEWHGKINFIPGVNLDRVCGLHRAHLSLNALKDEKDRRFITLREFGRREIFEGRIEGLTADLTLQGTPVIKEVSEYCIYDNNLYLDKGWLPR
jgi:hypothetical protein